MRNWVRSIMCVLALVGLLAACDAGAPPPAPAPPAAPASATAGARPPATTAAMAAPATGTPTAAPRDLGGDGQPVDLSALYHMSRDPMYRAPGGAVPAGTTVTLRLKAKAGNLTAATVRVWDSRASVEHLVPMVPERQEGDSEFWKAGVPTPATPDVLWYRFQVQNGAASAVYQDDATRDGGQGEGKLLANQNDYSINAYDPHWTIPAWMQDAVIYQIFPDRFNNGDPSNDRPAGQPVYDQTTTRSPWGQPPSGNAEFYGGDLQGVIAKLDYLQSLGVTVIYLNPIFDAASNHGYDTRDYTKIAPWFGTQATFDTLMAETKRRGLHVILDGVFNHVSSDSPYFDRYHHFPALGADESQQSPYYSWFRFAGWPTAYLDFGGYDTLPQLQENDTVKDFLFRKPDSVAQQWLRAGAAGWRLDAAQDKTDRFWQQFRSSVRAAFPDAVIIAEDTAGPANATAGLSGDEWDGVMNYRFQSAAWDFFKPQPDTSAEAFDKLLASMREDYPPNAILASMNLIDSHDTERALSAMGGDKNRLRLLALLQFTSLGAPTVYYGDEAGQGGGKDPDDRRTYPWGSEDSSLIAFYRTLAADRHRLSALRTGDTRTLLVHNDNRLYAYARHDPAGTALVAYNLGTGAQTLTLDVHDVLPDGTLLHDQLNNNTPYTVQGGHLAMQVPADWGALLLP